MRIHIFFEPPLKVDLMIDISNSESLALQLQIEEDNYARAQREIFLRKEADKLAKRELEKVKKKSRKKKSECVIM